MSSLKDLARECGVSVATVSKALNGQHDISDATRARVREAAERLGYVPNMAARSMKTNRTYNLGVLFVDERQSGLSHEYFSAVLDSFKVRVERLGYDITFINRNLGGKTMTYLEHYQLPAQLPPDEDDRETFRRPLGHDERGEFVPDQKIIFVVRAFL